MLVVCFGGVSFSYDETSSRSRGLPRGPGKMRAPLMRPLPCSQSLTYAHPFQFSQYGATGSAVRTGQFDRQTNDLVAAGRYL